MLPVNSIYVLPGGPFGNSFRGISEQFRLWCRWPDPVVASWSAISLPPNIPATILFLVWFVQSFIQLHFSTFLKAIVWIIFLNGLTGSADAFQGRIWELHITVACRVTLWLSDWHVIAVFVYFAWITLLQLHCVVLHNVDGCYMLS
jgi:hypothetical protein